MERLELTYFFKTKAQANDFSSRLATIIQRLYENDFSLEKALMDAFGLQKKEKFMTLLRDNQINIEKVDVLKTFLVKIQETISKMQIMDITIAFEPKEKNLQAIADWLLMNLNRQILFNITVDPQIIGGAKINYNGRYLDVTMQPVFEKILATMQQQPGIHHN